MTIDQLCARHLADARCVIVPSRRLEAAIPGSMRTPKGFAPEAFFDRGTRLGPLVIGWAGAVKPDKGIQMLKRAAPDIRIACSLPYDAMPSFYSDLDVIAIGSIAEGDPRTLIEGMACGCFPVTTDVGIAPELVRHGENGLIVRERSVTAFREAFAWCRENADQVRAAGRRNSQEMHETRTWSHVAPAWRAAIECALG